MQMSDAHKNDDEFVQQNFVNLPKRKRESMALVRVEAIIAQNDIFKSVLSSSVYRRIHCNVRFDKEECYSVSSNLWKALDCAWRIKFW